MFIEEDGLCHPSDGKCPPGTIPKFLEGCIPVGIPSCAPEFVEADGQCYPSPDKCPAGTFPVPSEGCVAIDGPEGCGSGIWGDIVDTAGTVWVDGSYTGGDSDGSQLKPASTLATALALVSPGGRIALAAGNYSEALALDFPVEIVGRCPSLVHLSGAAPTPYPYSATVLVDGTENVVLRRMRIGGAGVGVLAVNADVELAGVHVREANTAGVIGVMGTRLVADHLLVERTSADTNGNFGHGIDVELAAEVALTRSALLENRASAIFAADPGTRITLDDSVVARTLPQASDLGFGRGADVQQQATLALTRSALLENREVALQVMNDGTTVTVSESLIARTLPRDTNQTNGRGVNAQQGATLTLWRSALVENRDITLFIAHDGTNVTLSESLIARTQPQVNDLETGRGVDVQQGATLTVEASALLENHETAINATNAGTRVIIVESLLAHNRPEESSQTIGTGAFASGEAYLELLSSAVLDNVTAGVVLAACTGRVSGSLFEHVSEGKFNRYTCPPGKVWPCPGEESITATYEGIGDGVVVGFGATVDVEQTLVVAIARAAVLYQGSDGILRGVRAHGDRFGLVLQGQPHPDWQAADNLFEGGENAIVSDGQLPVPEAPPLPTQ
jgi:hypothetical protein